MDIKIGLTIVAIGYSLIYFFDSFFKSCSHYPYIRFLEGTGLRVNFFNIHWTTTAFNRTLLRLGNVHSYSKFFNLWFSFGLTASLILLPIAVVLLVYSFLQNLIPSNKEIILSPIIPGLNLPASELFFYSAALVICSVVHELGHAIAATKEDVQILNIGLNIIYILPIAFVNLNAENLRGVEPWKKLKILTAGVWHNLVLSFVCYIAYLLLPAVLGIFFQVGSGVTIYDSTKLSPLIGELGLDVGDKVFKINDCIVQTEKSWIECLQNASLKNGMCFDPDAVRELDETVTLKHLSNGYVECCDPSKKGNVCFEFIDNNNGILELPSHVCLPARTILSKSKYHCSKKHINCPDNYHCFVPLLNETRLFKIEVMNKRIVIYMGLMDDFLKTLRVSPFIPKLFFKTPVFAEATKKMLEFIIIISLGLGIINIIPCFFMDGQHVMNTLLYILLSQSFESDKVIMLSTMICLLFTMLLVAHCILTLMPFIF